MSTIMVEFGTTRDGDMAARVGDLAYIAIPLESGFSVASAWRLSRPIIEWHRGDVCGAECSVSDQQAFRAYVGDIALHLRQRQALGGQCAPNPGATHALRCTLVESEIDAPQQHDQMRHNARSFGVHSPPRTNRSAVSPILIPASMTNNNQ